MTALRNDYLEKRLKLEGLLEKKGVPGLLGNSLDDMCNFFA